MAYTVDTNWENVRSSKKPNMIRCKECGKKFEAKMPLGMFIEIPNNCPKCGAELYRYYHDIEEGQPV